MPSQRRIELKRRGGSKPYRQKPQIDAGGVYGYNPSRNDREGHILEVGGFDKLKVANKSNSDIIIQPGMNPKRGQVIESGTQEILEDVQPFGSYKVVNLDQSNSIPEGKLNITTKLSELTADDRARYQAAQDNQPDMTKLIGLAGGLI